MSRTCWSTSSLTTTPEAKPLFLIAKRATAAVQGRYRLMSNDIQTLAEQLQKGRCVLCAGSRLVGDSSYRSVVERLIKSLPEQEAGDAMSALDNSPLAAAGWVRRRLGD